MKDFQRGTPGFGILLGSIFTLAGLLLMTIGLWKTLLLIILFALGYFLGAVNNKTEMIKKTINKVVPEKKQEVFNFREELAKDQEAAQRGAATDGWKQEEKEDEE